jgi:hypothetical protein
MPDSLRRPVSVLLVPVVGIALLSQPAGAQNRPKKKPPASPPARAQPQPAAPLADPSTILGEWQRIRTLPAGQRSGSETALAAVAEFVIAVGESNGLKAADKIDPVGYQDLPLSGELPEEPGRPRAAGEIEKLFAGRPPVSLAGLPTTSFEVLTREKLRPRFTAVATWMLPKDYAVLIRPVPGWPEWVQRECCLVVRVRATRATIVGGNLLEALEPDRLDLSEPQVGVVLP